MSDKDLNLDDVDRRVSRDTGGPAFPSLEEFERYNDERGRYDRHYAVNGGMTLRDYFAAHAPVDRWRHYRPTMPMPKPEADWTGIAEAERHCDASPNNWKERAAWDAEERRQFDIQWPYFYADAMLAERKR